MKPFRPITTILGMALAALVHGGSASAAPGDAIIEVVVDPASGETTVRCVGMECESVDCAGNGQLMASGAPYNVRREDDDSCTTSSATDSQAENLDQGLQEGDDLFAAAEEGPTPAGGGQGGGQDDSGNTTTEVNESNQNQVGDTGESDVETPMDGDDDDDDDDDDDQG
jgi:hypothetical protein